MSDEQTTELQDVFSDAGSASATTGEGPFSNDNDDGAGDDTTQGGTDDTVAGGEEGEGQPGDTKAGTPPATEDDKDVVVDAKGQKLIPVHRMTAALKSATERAEKAERDLAERDKVVIPVPDKAADPEGYARHIRMEASVDIMRELRPDYQEVINHYAEMAKDNPLLDQAVDAAPVPARLAYDIAKKDLEIKEALKLKDSDEWKEFQEFKKNKTTTTTTTETNLGAKVANGLKAVPNLNRSTNASPNRNVRTRSNGDNDDALWADAKF